jgi:hypothetical protein
MDVLPTKPLLTTIPDLCLTFDFSPVHNCHLAVAMSCWLFCMASDPPLKGPLITQDPTDDYMTQPSRSS